MTDTIIKGTGNSRSIKSVPNLLTLYPTYESFAAALAGVGVPMDIGGLNEAGCQQIGDALNKANLLKNETAALYGKSEDAVPDEIFVAIKTLITTMQNSVNGKAKIEYGSKSGVYYDQSYTLSFSFVPKAIFCIFSSLLGFVLYPNTQSSLVGGSGANPKVLISSFSSSLSIKFSGGYTGTAYTLNYFVIG